MHPAVLSPALLTRAERVRSYGILSTFPPTSCGIATFSAALSAGLIADGASVDVVRCGAGPEIEDALVVATLADDRASGAIAALNAVDVAIVQHEYGLYGGLDGDAVVTLMEAIDVPLVAVAHTVLQAPSAHQRVVLERVCALADVVVVMTETARVRLAAGFDVDGSKIVVIAHGAATPPVPCAPSLTSGRPVGHPARLLTWGLLGPGKGIEWAIDALALLTDVAPQPQYVIAGATHPKVREQSGEVYREMLVARSETSGAAGSIAFDDTYRDLASLNELITSADVVVLPYDSKDQVTSGVLVDAVAAGIPVVATAFPHARELLASGAGIVVPQRDPAALAAAIRSIVTDPARAEAMRAEARRLAPSLSWGAVARQYSRLADRLLPVCTAVAS